MLANITPQQWTLIQKIEKELGIKCPATNSVDAKIWIESYIGRAYRSKFARRARRLLVPEIDPQYLRS